MSIVIIFYYLFINQAKVFKYRGLLRLILVDTLRSVTNVGFLMERLKCFHEPRPWS